MAVGGIGGDGNDGYNGDGDGDSSGNGNGDGNGDSFGDCNGEDGNGDVNGKGNVVRYPLSSYKGNTPLGRDVSRSACTWKRMRLQTHCLFLHSTTLHSTLYGIPT